MASFSVSTLFNLQIMITYSKEKTCIIRSWFVVQLEYAFDKYLDLHKMHGTDPFQPNIQLTQTSEIFGRIVDHLTRIKVWKIPFLFFDGFFWNQIKSTKSEIF